MAVTAPVTCPYQMSGEVIQKRCLAAKLDSINLPFTPFVVSMGVVQALPAPGIKYVEPYKKASTRFKAGQEWQRWLVPHPLSTQIHLSQGLVSRHTPKP